MSTVSVNMQVPESLGSVPDDNAPEAIAAQRRRMQALELVAIRKLGPCPADLRQSSFDIHLLDGFVSHTVLIRPTLKTPRNSPSIKRCPLIIYFHGGSFTFDTPYFALSPARAFASYFGAIVACCSYKLSPENPFPDPVRSAWEVVSWLSDPQNLNNGPLKDEETQYDPQSGFILAGCGAGATIAAVIAGVAAAVEGGSRELIRGLHDISVPITGLFISLPYLLDPEIVPTKHASAFRSREQNLIGPIMNATSLMNMVKRLRPDVHSPWFSPLNIDLAKIRQHHSNKVYIQCGDLDILRDDAIIYQRVLNESEAAETKIDILKDSFHLAWVSLPFSQTHTQEIKEKSMDGMAWLLDKDWDRSIPLPY